MHRVPRDGTCAGGGKVSKMTNKDDKNRDRCKQSIGNSITPTVSMRQIMDYVFAHYVPADYVEHPPETYDIGGLILDFVRGEIGLEVTDE